jgi:hypothetical protein
VRRFWGGLVIAAGVLVTLLSGLCTLLLGAPMLLQGSGPAPLSSWLLLVISGGPPLVVGVGLAILGHRIGWGVKRAPSPAARGWRRFVAIMMIVVGGLSAVAGVLSSGASLFGGGLAVIPSLVTLAVGVGLVWGGVTLWRDPTVRPPTDVF